MFQDPHASLDPRMRVGAIIGEPLAIQHLGSRQQQRDRVFELLGEVGLPRNAVERYPHEFSGGQRQRIGLARALTMNPRLIVADEPVSALDVSIRAQVLNLMKRLQQTHGLTYVVISHDLAVVKYMADRIGVMYLGKLVELGSADDIYQRAAHPYTAGLIATDPGARPGRGEGQGERGHQGRAAEPGEPAVRVPVPHPVPVRAGAVLGGRAGPADVRRRARGRLPLPAPVPGRVGRGVTGQRAGFLAGDRFPTAVGERARPAMAGPVRMSGPRGLEVEAPVPARRGVAGRPVQPGVRVGQRGVSSPSPICMTHQQV